MPRKRKRKTWVQKYADSVIKDLQKNPQSLPESNQREVITLMVENKMGIWATLLGWMIPQIVNLIIQWLNNRNT